MLLLDGSLLGLYFDVMLDPGSLIFPGHLSLRSLICLKRHSCLNAIIPFHMPHGRCPFEVRLLTHVNGVGRDLSIELVRTKPLVELSVRRLLGSIRVVGNPRRDPCSFVLQRCLGARTQSQVVIRWVLLLEDGVTPAFNEEGLQGLQQGLSSLFLL